MSKGDIETYHEDGQWKNRAQGNSRASNVHDTKQQRRRLAARWPGTGAWSTSSRRWTAPSVRRTPTGGTPTRRGADRTEPRVLPVESAGFCIFWLRRTQVQMYRSG